MSDPVVERIIDTPLQLAQASAPGIPSPAQIGEGTLKGKDVGIGMPGEVNHAYSGPTAPMRIGYDWQR